MGHQGQAAGGVAHNQYFPIPVVGGLEEVEALQQDFYSVPVLLFFVCLVCCTVVLEDMCLLGDSKQHPG